mmetsp:Transcript_42464/g.117160  ORF Transcript_42464/g.117160 Transcript_42464/m.117160 type:complete len:243 (-) Transcript_42464:118-846(-)
MAGKYHVDATQHTLQPIVTGATVIGLKYNGGVMMAADTLASYGSSARYKDVSRVSKVGKYTLLGASGEMSDFQYLGNLLAELDLEDYLHEDGCSMGPHEYAAYIGRVMYNRRSKMNPLFNQFVVAGKKENQDPLLAFVDHQGTYFEENYVATGFGSHLATPLLRLEWKPELTADEAKALIVKCLQLCFYRDCKAYYKIVIGDCDGIHQTVSEPMPMDHFWSHPMWLEKRLEGGKSGEISDTW